MKLHLVLALAGVTVACASQPHRSTAANRRHDESKTPEEFAEATHDADDRVVTTGAPRHSLDRHNASADGYVEPADRENELTERGDAEQPEVDERAADNTAQNGVGAEEGRSVPSGARAKSGGLTPFDQGSSESDRRTTQEIRKAVMADDSLSFNAKNIKIITRDGYVVLRGPVNNQKERVTIQQLANRVVGADARVDNQLQAK